MVVLVGGRAGRLPGQLHTRAFCALTLALCLGQTTPEAAALDWYPAPLPGGPAPIIQLLGLGTAPVPPERFVLELARSTFNIPEGQRKAVDDLHNLRV
ncbi:MAG: hypothetical protein HY654_03005, partial [Acidobacteria bacterium]|nr:hypothetical protein [Acidobacteriota bacterium]